MTPEERHRELRDIGAQIGSLWSRLRLVQPELALLVDQRAMESILTHLIWAAENCCVIGNHQVGKSMHDTMGMSHDGKVV